ncbi:ArgS-related anticodon-binding protein NrtL [Streptomyces sp. TLI_185]|uniref:ArgS-related anticodon-binding protein NrtL n=1 Tax=Streptomyces sp. TLI_185 TaxID=2485151 RepID=UPI000F4E5288|nr:DALR anticodon-binding domain-containing protein [Streptomyces sp. TLI_185]RPF36262.1 arginyl-tRNA synthetase [Streptomyces sp. TLI_185]
MTPVELSRTVLRAVRRAVDEGELSVAVPQRAVVVPPGPGGCGDYATNIALQLARPAGQPPRRVAEILQQHLARTDGVEDVVVTGPGFINISLHGAGATAAALTREILRDGTAYGHSDALAGQVVELRIPYEVRAEVVADALVRIVGSQGGRVEVDHGEPVNLRPVPAPDDPALLGPDAARWALLHPAAHDRPRITADHLVQRESNPLFRVRYAHARTRALSRNAADLGFTPEPGDVEHVQEDVAALLAVLADHPRVLARAAAQRTPDSLARHLVTVADAVLAVLPVVLPRGDEKPSAAHRARLALAEGAGAVLAGGLSLLGIDAPQHL